MRRYGAGAVARVAKRVDGNQSDIVRRLEQIPGLGVLVLNAEIDLILGWNGVNFLVDLKNPNSSARRHRTPTQRALLESWPGQVAICETFEQVLEVVGLILPPKFRLDTPLENRHLPRDTT